MRRHAERAPAIGLFAALALSLGAPPGRTATPAVSPIPSTAELRSLWGGGTWKPDVAPGGGMLSHFKPGTYTDPNAVPDNPMPLNAEAMVRYRHIREEYGKGRAIFAPYAECHPAGMPYLLTMDGYGGYEAVVGVNELMLLYGNGDYRRIYLRGHVHPGPAAPGTDSEGGDYPGSNDSTYNGDSIAHWEGRTMVVDTTNIRGANTQIEPHFPKPEGTHIVERYTPTRPGRMDVEMTMTNPVFTRPWVVKFHINRDPKGQLKEYHCTDGNRWAMDPNEGLIMRGPDGKPLPKAED